MHFVQEKPTAWQARTSQQISSPILGVKPTKDSGRRALINRENGACGLGITESQQGLEFSATVPYPGTLRGFFAAQGN